MPSVDTTQKNEEKAVKYWNRNPVLPIIGITIFIFIALFFFLKDFNKKKPLEPTDPVEISTETTQTEPTAKTISFHQEGDFTCVQTAESFQIKTHNTSGQLKTYTLAVHLQQANNIRTTPTIITIPKVPPGETRFTAIPSENSTASSCTIQTIETDRQILTVTTNE